MGDSVQITVEQHADPARETVGAVASSGYRAGNLSAYQAQRLLGFRTRREL